MAASDVRAGGAFVELYTKDAAFQKGLEAATRRLKAWGASVTAVGASIGAIGASIMAPILAAAQRFGSFGSQLDKMSQRTGLGVEFLSQLAFAAKMSDASLSDLQVGAVGMAKFMSAIVDGGDGAQAMLAKLGLTAEQLQNQTPEGRFLLLAEAISKIPDPSLRAAAAMQIFGKAGVTLLPLLNKGADGIQEMMRQAKALGIAMSKEDVAAADRFGDALDQLKIVMGAVGTQIGAAVAPKLTALANTLSFGLKLVIDFVRENRTLVAVSLGVGTALAATGAAVVALGGSLLMASASLSALGTAAALAFLPFRLARTSLFSVSGATERVRQNLRTVAVAARTAAQEVGAAFARLSGSLGQLSVPLAGMRSGFAQMSAGAGQVAQAMRPIGASLGRMLWSGVVTSARFAGAQIADAIRLPLLRLQSTMRPLLSRMWDSVGPRARTAFMQAAIFAMPALLRISAAATAAAERTKAVWSSVGPAISRSLNVATLAFRRLQAVAVTAGRGVIGGVRSIGSGAAGVLFGVAQAVSILGMGMGGLVGRLAMALPQFLLLGSAVSSLLTPFGLLAAAIAGGVYLWMRYSDSGQAAFTRVSGMAREAYSLISTAISGISDAVSAGDFALAGQIAMTGLKAGMLAGTAALADAVGGEMGNFIGTLGQQIASGDMQAAWKTAVLGMSAVWHAFSAGVVQVFASAAKALIDLWLQTTTKISNAILQSAKEGGWGKMFLMGTGVDLQKDHEASLAAKRAVMATAQKGLSQQEANLTALDAGQTVIGPNGQPMTREEVLQGIANYKAMIAQAGGPDTFLQDAQRGAADQLQGQADAMRRAIEEVERTADANAATAGNNLAQGTRGGGDRARKAAAEARAELDRLRAEADKARQEKEARDKKRRDEMAAGAASAGQSTAEARGTFSAATRVLEGAQHDKLDRVAKAAEKNNQQNEEIIGALEEQEEAGLAFG